MFVLVISIYPSRYKQFISNNTTPDLDIAYGYGEACKSRYRQVIKCKSSGLALRRLVVLFGKINIFFSVYGLQTLMIVSYLYYLFLSAGHNILDCYISNVSISFCILFLI